MFDPNYRSLSLDEASLHVTPYLEQHKDTNALELAKLIRKLVFKETQLTCSIGMNSCIIQSSSLKLNQTSLP